MQPATGTAPQTQQTQQAPQIGERRTMRDGRDVVYDGRGWRLVIPASGSGGTGSDPTDTRGVQASAEQRGRINITFAPALEAQETIRRIEQQEAATTGDPNLYNREWGARMLEAVPWDSGSVARTVGGSDYGQYESASRAFESAMLPILSGAAVTESEARRMIRAALPQLGDSAEVLAEKERRRAQMLNGASAALGYDPMFPEAQPSMTPRTPSQQLPSIPLSDRRTSRVRAAERSAANSAGTSFPLTPAARDAYSRLPRGFNPRAQEGSEQRPFYLGDIPESDLRVGQYAITPDGRFVQGQAPQRVAIPGQRGGQGQSQPVAITSDAEYNALPSGTQFRAPDGTVRVKP